MQNAPSDLTHVGSYQLINFRLLENKRLVAYQRVQADEYALKSVCGAWKTEGRLLGEEEEGVPAGASILRRLATELVKYQV